MNRQRPTPDGRHTPYVAKSGPGVGAGIAWLLFLVMLAAAAYVFRVPIMTQVRQALGTATAAATPRPVALATPTPAPVVAQAVPVPQATPVATPTPMPTPEVAQATPVPESTPVPAPVYPGLPALTLSLATPIGDPDFTRLLKTTQWVAQNGGWDQHRQALDAALITAATLRGPVEYQASLEAILGQRTASLMLAQDGVLHAIDPGSLENLPKDADTEHFLTWLFSDARAANLLAQTIKPQNDPARVLEVWRDCWKADPQGAEPYMGLALAVAVDFDHPVTVPSRYYSTGGEADAGQSASSTIDPVQRYLFYRNSEAHGVLKASLVEMLPDELIWVVNAAVPDEELLWAQQNLHYSRSSWGDAYGSIRYRMDKAAGGVQLYDRYTLAEILKNGGICEDQAYFASISAKANGIPAMAVDGEGDRGGHAWVQWESARDTWSEAGRYADNYAAGETTNPQTHEKMKEQELRQTTQPERRTEAWALAERYLQLSSLLAGAARPEAAQIALQAAVQDAPQNLDAWNRLLDGMAAAKASASDWETEIGQMRVMFQKYPDIIQQINKRETDYLATTGDAQAVEEAARRQENRFNRDDSSRTDLITGSVFQQADAAAKAGDTEAAGRIFREALREKGNTAVPFKSIAKQYYDWAHQQNEGSRAARDIELTFQRNFHPDGDYFELTEYSGMLDFIIDLYNKEGMEPDAHRLQISQKQVQRQIDTMKTSAKQGE
ncbi:MAG TPA: hypothetical protein VHY22_16365 [Chthoniobacteraceae bacterium]|jgi:hypothetical protein|nr:hypothetical protein [Chthoniobacteraceae bacterium]